MIVRHRASGLAAFAAVLAFGLACGVLDGAALADGKVTTASQPAGLAAGPALKATKPGPVKDIYCSHSGNTKFQACGKDFAAKCKEIGGKLKDPTGNPDYGACIHDDVW